MKTYFALFNGRVREFCKDEDGNIYILVGVSDKKFEGGRFSFTEKWELFRKAKEA